MEWMMYLMGGIAVAAVVLALYERRKNLRMSYDVPQEPRQRSDRQAYDKVEEMRNIAQFKSTRHLGL